MCRGLPLADVETAGTVLNSIQLLLDSLSASSSSDSNGTKSKQQQFVVVTRIMVYLRETIALTRSSELQEMYAAFVVAVANNYYISKTYKKRLSAKLLDIASSQNNSGGVIDVYTSVSACFEIFANEMHEAEREERDRKQKKRKTHASMKQSRVEIACSETSKKEQEELVLNALLEYVSYCVCVCVCVVTSSLIDTNASSGTPMTTRLRCDVESASQTPNMYTHTGIVYEENVRSIVAEPRI